MKRLHELTEERWQFKALAVMDGIVRRPEKPTQFILLLHGLNERGRRIYRKLLPYLPEDAIILAPNGPFPLPKIKDRTVEFGYTWYFFDPFEQKYYLNQDLAKSWIKELLHLNELKDLPLTIIGFSQGGYLAPLVGKEMPQTKLVIGIGCEFRHTLIKGPLNFRLEAIHGSLDEVIKPENAMHELELLKAANIESTWHLVNDTAHEISHATGLKVKEILEAHGEGSL